MPKTHILIVDDEPGIRFGVRDYLEARGYSVTEADSCAAAVMAFRTARPDAALLDYRLGDGTALDLLPRLRAIDPTVPTMVLTAHGTIDLAVQAIKQGAEQFLTKPVELATLVLMLERVIENQKNRRRQELRKTRQARETVDPFVGMSAPVQALAAVARKVVASDSPVLLTGESGTGKGVLARWLHALGPRADESFVEMNCAGLSSELLDSELFGHEKGAFTGAVKEKTGLLEVAHGGTLFLDEIGDMELQVQAKLLKVLEEQRFRRLGDVRDRTVDVRLVAATHQDLRQRVQDGKFRHDLYFRINTIELVVPPLRDRGGDIALLARELLDRLAIDLGRPGIHLSADGEAALRGYGWPGNVRELRNVLERAVLLADGDTLGSRDLYFVPMNLAAAPAAAPDDNMTLEQVEIQHIQRVLDAVGGKVQHAAERLGVPKSTFYQKLRALGIDPATYRGKG